MKPNTWRRWVTESTRPSYELLRFFYFSSSTRPRREYPSSWPQQPPLSFPFFQRYCRRSSSGPGGVSSFSEFSLSDLQAATNNFSSHFIVSESGEKAPSVVYKGRFQNQSNRRWIAVNKFTKLAWPDPEQFEDEAWGVGKLRHKRVANLIGYC